MKRSARFDIILKLLEANYRGAETALSYKNPFELLIATILSAQCTDKQVNKITPALFKKFPRPEDYIDLSVDTLSKYIKSCGFYKTKSRHIIATCNILVGDHKSSVPDDMESLIKLPGVGRKTANVVLSSAFGKAAIAVDTHVFRVSNRLGLAEADNVETTEEQLMENIPKNKWSKAHHWLIYHGRQICKARNPQCDKCFLLLYCKYGANSNKK
ncbi:MAG TPA: endonuclease III [Bacillota bacterium]|nr:endonuclease III [Bacillota bacterium]